MKDVASSPPAKNPTTARREARWSDASPAIPCPDVQPPAYAVPNPTRNPPPRIRIAPGLSGGAAS